MENVFGISRISKSSTAVDERLEAICRLTSAIGYAFSVTPARTLSLDWISADFAEITGFQASELLPDGWRRVVAAEDLPVLDGAFKTVCAGGPVSAEIRVSTSAGRVRLFHFTAYPVADAGGQVVRVFGAARDVTEQRDHERREAVDSSIARALSESPGLETSIPRILEAYARALSCSVAAYWRRDASDRSLHRERTWAAPGLGVESFYLSQSMMSCDDTSLLGRVCQERRSVVVADVVTDTRFLRAAWAVKAGLRGAHAFPVLNGTDLVGVIECFSRAPADPQPLLADTLAAAAGRLGQYIRRKEAEETIRRSEALTRAILDSSLDGIVTADHEGCIVEFSGAAERLLGYSRSAVLGHRVLETIVPPRLREEYRVALDAYLMSRDPADLVQRGEAVALTRTGEEVPVELSLVPVPRQPPLFTAYLRDLRPRRDLECELRRKEEDFIEFCENATVGLHWVREDGTIEWANQAELDMLGYSREEYIGRSINEFHADQDLIRTMLGRLTRGERLRNQPATMKAKSGALKQVIINSSVYVRDGKFIHTRCFTIERPRGENAV